MMRLCPNMRSKINRLVKHWRERDFSQIEINNGNPSFLVRDLIKNVHIGRNKQIILDSYSLWWLNTQEVNQEIDEVRFKETY